MNPPAETFYVSVKFKDTRSRRSAGVKGGKVSSLEAALTRKRAILAHDPNASVRMFKSKTVWEEVTE